LHYFADNGKLVLTIKKAVKRRGSANSQTVTQVKRPPTQRPKSHDSHAHYTGMGQRWTTEDFW